MAKKFEKHMMYGDGKSEMADTNAEHLKLKKKGWGHKKPKTPSPLQINQALIENYKGVNKYTRTGGGTRTPEIDFDDATKMMARTAVGGLSKGIINPKQKKKKNKKVKNNNKKTTTNNFFDNDGIDEFVDDNTSLLPPPPENNDDNGLFDPIKEEVVDYSVPTDTNNKTDVVEETNIDSEKSKDKKSKNKYKVQKKGKLFSKKNKFRYDENTRRRLRQEGRLDEANEGLYRVKKRGLFNDKTMNKDEFNTFKEDENLLRRGNTNSNRVQGDYYSPLEAQSSSYFGRRFTNKGKTPLFFQTPTEPQNEDILLSMQMQNQNIEQDVDKYISNSSLVGDEKLDILGSQANAKVFQYAKSIKDDAAMRIEQDGDAGGRVINDSINTLRGLTQKVNNLIDKKAEWIENNGGGESTRRNFSKGSSGKNKFVQNAIFSERDDLFQILMPEIEVNADGSSTFADIVFDFDGEQVQSSDIFTNVFLKPEQKFADFRKQAVKLANDARQRRPFNEYHTSVAIDSLLDSKENILSFAWDDFAGPSFVEQYTDVNQEEDPTWMDVDSPNFNENKLKDEVAFWLKEKLKTEHKMSMVNQQIDTSEELTPKQLLEKYSIS